MTFEELGLSPETLRAVTEKGYTNPTPIQEKAIPAIMMTRDVVGLAQTGTGKTASFTLPMIDALAGGRARMRMPRSLVLTPTRELAAQVAQNFKDYGKYHKLSMALLVGGESMADQTKLLDKGVDVLIATPGRLLDLFQRGSILLNDIRILVIDEADRMLDMGFIPDIERIVSLIPPTRQTLLFSATMAPEIKRLTEKFLSNPKEISVAPPATTATTVEQFLVHTTPRDKKRVLGRILKQENPKNAFVFLNRKRDISDVAGWLKKEGYDAAPLHGDMVQAKRTETLQGFRDGSVKFLVCSDVAARGLDISAVSHVFNYDVPMNPDDYVHRIGRTGRAGQSGRAWMLATKEDEKFLVNVEKTIKKPVPVYTFPDAPQAVEGEERDVREDRRPQRREREPRPARDERPARPQQAQRPARNENSRDDDDNVVGFGDDIPAFLR
ncbi:MAG: DNA helicase [Micavibrio aeruginosavorus]|uniref:DEAD-box ATP-dependent RNA helicase RhpA n=1 Tax=Micavibrio aeruginosavorus TaxID=349221 RepID=A0A2W4ZTW1_9BACT|nr:MAG: DNA helicase [Micavibrio aeruginosavorus]